MYIDEIPVNSKISIGFDYVSKTANLETTIKKPGPDNKSGRCIIANAARVNDKIVNLNNFRGRVNIRFSKPGEKRCDI